MVKHLSTCVILFMLRILPRMVFGLILDFFLALPSTKTKKTLGDRAFTAAAPSLWNKLPREIREKDNFESFMHSVRKKHRAHSVTCELSET